MVKIDQGAVALMAPADATRGTKAAILFSGSDLGSGALNSTGGSDPGSGCS